MMKRILLTLALLIVIVTVWQLRSSRWAQGIHQVTSSFSLPSAPTAEIQRQVEALSSMPTKSAEIKIQESFFNLQLHESSEANLSALENLEAGLWSQEPVLKDQSGALVQNLLVDVAHGGVHVLPRYQERLNRLFLVWKTRQPERLARIQKANPDSPIFQYLQKI